MTDQAASTIASWIYDCTNRSYVSSIGLRLLGTRVIR